MSWLQRCIVSKKTSLLYSSVFLEYLLYCILYFIWVVKKSKLDFIFTSLHFLNNLLMACFYSTFTLVYLRVCMFFTQESDPGRETDGSLLPWRRTRATPPSTDKLLPPQDSWAARPTRTTRDRSESGCRFPHRHWCWSGHGTCDICHGSVDCVTVIHYLTHVLQ